MREGVTFETQWHTFRNRNAVSLSLALSGRGTRLPRNTMRVLIVDDEPSIRRTTRIAVESSGHAAAEAPNAAKAIKAAEAEGFDAVFLDVKLGADDGHAILPGRQGLGDVKVIAGADLVNGG